MRSFDKYNSNALTRFNHSSIHQQTHNWSILHDLKVRDTFMVVNEGDNLILQKKNI